MAFYLIIFYGSYGILWPFYGLLWSIFLGLVSSFLAVKDPNSFDLVQYIGAVWAYFLLRNYVLGNKNFVNRQFKTDHQYR